MPNCQSSFGRAGSFYQNNHESKFRLLFAFVSLCLRCLNNFISQVHSLNLNRVTYRAAESSALAIAGWKVSGQQHWSDSSRGSESINESCVAAPHIQYISHISSWHELSTIQASILGKLPSYIALYAVWSLVEHGHWPSCQNKSLFPTLYLLLHFIRLMLPFFLFQFQASPLTESIRCTLMIPVWSLKD